MPTGTGKVKICIKITNHGEEDGKHLTPDTPEGYPMLKIVQVDREKVKI